MSTLVTGTPGSGKTSLVQYAEKLGDARFFDADEVPGLCEWREFGSEKVLGLVTEHKETGEDSWYEKYGWYWKGDVLGDFLAQNRDAILCGSSENVTDCYHFFDKIIIILVTEMELLHNLAHPSRNNPFGKTENQRAGFMKWQEYLIREAEKFRLNLIEGNETSRTYKEIIS